MAPPATVADALELMKKDPVVGFVAIPTIAIKGAGAEIAAPVKGRTVALPPWTGKEWDWYGGLAFDVARRLQADGIDGFIDLFDGHASKSVRRAAENLRPLSKPMLDLGATQPTPAAAGAYYEAAVKLVIAAVAAHGRKGAGEILLESIKESLVQAPATVVDGIKVGISEGADGLAFIGRQANKIVRSVFGVGVGTIVMIAVVGYLWLESRKGRRARQED